MMGTPLCINCKHFTRFLSGKAMCRRPTSTRPDPVLGEVIETLAAEARDERLPGSARTSFFGRRLRCGPDAIFFEEREPTLLDLTRSYLTNRSSVSVEALLAHCQRQSKETVHDRTLRQILLRLGWRRLCGRNSYLAPDDWVSEAEREPKWSWWAAEGANADWFQINQPTRDEVIAAARREYGDAATITIIEATQDGPFNADIFHDPFELIGERFTTANDRWGEDSFEEAGVGKEAEDELAKMLGDALAAWLDKHGRFIPTSSFTGERNKEIIGPVAMAEGAV